MSRLLALLAGLALLCSCTTPYQAYREDADCSYIQGSCGGVQVTALGHNTYGIYVQINNNGSPALAMSYFERKRQELSLTTGHDFCETLYVDIRPTEPVLIEGYLTLDGNVGSEVDGQVRCYTEIVILP